MRPKNAPDPQVEAGSTTLQRVVPTPGVAWPASLHSEELTRRFHIDLVNGTIWVDDQRILLLQASWFGDLRNELIDRLGLSTARQVLTQLGYRAGTRDGLLAMKLNPGMALIDLIQSGASFHAFQGSVAVVPVRMEVDIENGRCYIEFQWKNSVEDEVQSRSAPAGPHREPACWMEVGYASGHLSAVIGRQVIVREVECTSMGFDLCRCIARLADEWEDPEEDLIRLDVATPGPSSLVCSPESPDEEPIVGRSAAYATTLHQLSRVARTDATILLLGESGVGKSALAAHAHRLSTRAKGPFVEVNCAAIPESLLEAELFGVEKGAFTGAHAQRHGRFESANGGTLFLDEIGLLPSSAQGKVLRALQAQKFERLGSSETRTADVRLIVATNIDLQEAVRAGSFRSDLYYRINVFPVQVPPLRERGGDLPLLAESIIRRLCRKYRLPVTGLTSQAHRRLVQYGWPGNIRELENAIERALILAEPGQLLDSHHFSAIDDATLIGGGKLWLDVEGLLDDVNASHRTSAGVDDPAVDDSAGLTLLDLEKRHVAAALRACGGNVAQAAKRLGLTRAQIDYRIKKWDWQ